MLAKFKVWDRQVVFMDSFADGANFFRLASDLARSDVVELKADELQSRLQSFAEYIHHLEKFNSYAVSRDERLFEPAVKFLSMDTGLMIGPTVDVIYKDEFVRRVQSRFVDFLSRNAAFMAIELPNIQTRAGLVRKNLQVYKEALGEVERNASEFVIFLSTRAKALEEQIVSEYNLSLRFRQKWNSRRSEHFFRVLALACFRGWLDHLKSTRKFDFYAIYQQMIGLGYIGEGAGFSDAVLFFERYLPDCKPDFIDDLKKLIQKWWPECAEAISISGFLHMFNLYISFFATDIRFLMESPE